MAGKPIAQPRFEASATMSRTRGFKAEARFLATLPERRENQHRLSAMGKSETAKASSRASA